MSTSVDYNHACRVLEDRFGIKFVVERSPSGGTMLHGRYTCRAFVVLDEEMLSYKTAEVVFDAAQRLKYKVCELAFEQLLGAEDHDESRRIANAAYEYRLACFELQPLWERMSKTPKNSALAAHYEKEYEDVQKKIAAKREALLKLARASAQETL